MVSVSLDKLMLLRSCLMYHRASTWKVFAMFVLCPTDSYCRFYHMRPHPNFYHSPMPLWRPFHWACIRSMHCWNHTKTLKPIRCECQLCAVEIYSLRQCIDDLIRLIGCAHFVVISRLSHICAYRTLHAIGWIDIVFSQNIVQFGQHFGDASWITAINTTIISTVSVASAAIASVQSANHFGNDQKCTDSNDSAKHNAAQINFHWAISVSNAWCVRIWLENEQNKKPYRI